MLQIRTFKEFYVAANFKISIHQLINRPCNVTVFAGVSIKTAIYFGNENKEIPLKKGPPIELKWKRLKIKRPEFH